MRYLKYVALTVLILAIPVSFLYGKRYERNRMKMKINSQVINIKDYTTWLEERYGPELLRMMAQYYLVTQEATKQGWKIDDKAIEKTIDDRADMDPNFSIRLQQQPWMRNQFRIAEETRSAMFYLATKDVNSTPDELRDFFNKQPGVYDEPDRVEIVALRAQNKDVADQAAALLVNLAKSNPSTLNRKDACSQALTVRDQLNPKVGLISADGYWLIKPKYGTSTANPEKNPFATMKPGDVKVVTEPNAAAPSGNVYTVVKLLKITTGHAVTFDEVKDRVEHDFKQSRSTPDAEIMHKLWDNSDIQTDPPTLKRDVELMLFPERASQAPSN